MNMYGHLGSSVEALTLIPHVDTMPRPVDSQSHPDTPCPTGFNRGECLPADPARCMPCQKLSGR